MSKRPRSEYEADLQAQQSPYVVYGTPLPPLDPNIRDDGSFVPVWKQDVRDERGRKRLHGAFTGGFSAGYFNTVGSKEGWTPSTFVSSKSKRWKDSGESEQKPEDFMDEEDLAEQEESKTLEAREGFSGLGSTSGEFSKRQTVMELLRPSGDTMGERLLRRMGWRDGQGIGPKVRRQARLDDGELDGDTHLFAPENTHIISFVRKSDHKGLGYSGEARLSKEEPEEVEAKPAKPAKRTGLGVGILNDNGSDEDDPYEMGPKISYNRVIGEKKKKKRTAPSKSLSNANPLLRDKPIFMSKASLGKRDRKCFDGRPPLPGFVLASSPPTTSSVRYPPPEVPDGWEPAAHRKGSAASGENISTADLAKASQLNPSSRGELLGESKLPGKSVFAYLTPAARDKLAALTKNNSLPAAGSEVGSASREPGVAIPELDPHTAANALGRGVSGFVPYADNPEKLARYRSFLSYRANVTPEAPAKPPEMRREDFIAELNEFAHAATIFKPMTGLMAQRFTSSSSSAAKDGSTPQRAAAKDPAEEAARMGMFGPLTFSTSHWQPSRLLCKRFGVTPPADVTGDVAVTAKTPIPTPGPASNVGAFPSENASQLADLTSKFNSSGFQVEGSDGGRKKKELIGKDDMEAMKREAGLEGPEHEPEKIDPERNEALEGERPDDAVFKAIFGSDSEDDE